MADNSSNANTYQGTGPHADRGVLIIIAMIIAVILLMAAVTQGHNSVDQGSDVPPGSYSSAMPADG